MAGIACTLGACFGIASTAQAAFVAEARDAAGDATSGHAGHDILQVGFAYDSRRGSLVGSIQLRGMPGSGEPAQLALVAATRTPSGCGTFPMAGFSSSLTGWGANWLHLAGEDRGPVGEADKRGAGMSTQSFEASDHRLRGTRWNCLYAAIFDPNDPNNVYDSVTVMGFTGMPELALGLPEPKNPLPANRGRKLRITLGNPGDGPLRNLRVRVKSPKGVKVAPRSRLIRRIKAGGRKTVTLNVTATRRASYTSRIQVTARSGKLVSKGSIRIERQRPKPKPRRGGGGSGGGGGDQITTCLRYQPDLSGETGGSLVMVLC